MYDMLYAILNKRENAKLQYFIYFVRKYLLKLDIQQAIRRNSTDLSLLMSELCSCLCLKLYSLIFTNAHAQERLLCFSEFAILVLHYYARKLSYHLKQAQKSISNLSNF